jgi:hypothetical protein
VKTGLTVLVLLATLALVTAFAPLPQDAAAPPAQAPQQTALDGWLGTWTADISLGGAPAKGKDVSRRDYGGMWIVSEFEAELFGAPFKGLALLGWDAGRNAYVWSWIDSMTPAFTLAEGQFSADGKVLTCTATRQGPDGQPQKVEHVMTFRDADTRVFELSEVAADGTRVTGLTITYTRQK